jgi:carbonic anhydrase
MYIAAAVNVTARLVPAVTGLRDAIAAKAEEWKDIVKIGRTHVQDSDSRRVPANEIVGLAPGELFVHRNVANLAPPQDVNYLSVLQFAVDVLRVKHIMVVGHYGCGGVSAALDGQRRGLVDHWLHPIREVRHRHRRELDAIVDVHARDDRLCELNVIRQVINVASDVIVQDAWERGQNLLVHGWVYSLANGLVTDLDVTISRPEEIERLD